MVQLWRSFGFFLYDIVERNDNSSSTAPPPLNPRAAATKTMSTQQEEGWQLGLRPLDMRAGNRNLSVTLSYSTLLTSSPSRFSTSSKYLGSFSSGQSVTLGSLMGVSSITGLSQRSSVGSRNVAETSRWRFNCKSKKW